MHYNLEPYRNNNHEHNSTYVKKRLSGSTLTLPQRQTNSNVRSSFSPVLVDMLMQNSDVDRSPSVPSQVQVLKYKRTVSSALWISISMIACYLPFAVVAAVRVTHQDPSYGITVSLIYFNSSFNPVLYCWRIRELRRAVKATIGLFCFFCP